MKIYKLLVIIIIFLLLFIPAVYAAEDAVIFYPATKILSVEGQCEKKDVLILIYYAGTDKIWGSGNVKCQDGQYQYSQNFNDWKISDGEFEVEIYDGGYKAKKDSPNAPAAREIVIIEGMNLKNSSALTPAAPEDNSRPADGGLVFADAETSAAETAAAPEGNDNFSLNGVLNFFFGVVRNVGDAIQNFAVVIAKTIKTTTLAAIKIFAKDLAIVPDGKIAVPAGENQMSGRAIISAGTAQVKINNGKITERSKIFLTPLSEINLPLAIIEKNSGQGFTAGISQVAEKDIAFDWLIIESYNARIDAAGAASPAQNISPPVLPPAPITENQPAEPQAPSAEISPAEPPASASEIIPSEPQAPSAEISPAEPPASNSESAPSEPLPAASDLNQPEESPADNSSDSPTTN
jgi:hypothetical protein